jgi:hypothetical protein
MRKPLKPIELVEKHFQIINNMLHEYREEAVKKGDELMISNIDSAVNDIDFFLRKLVFTRF